MRAVLADARFVEVARSGVSSSPAFGFVGGGKRKKKSV